MRCLSVFRSSICFSIFVIITESSNVKVHLQDCYFQLAPIPQEANILYLESALLNGEVTPMELIQQVLKKTVNLKQLEKYNNLELVNGLQVQNEILELMDELNTRKVDKQFDQAIRDGLKSLDNLEKIDLTTSISQISNKVKDEIDQIQKRAAIPFVFANSESLEYIEKIIHAWALFKADRSSYSPFTTPGEKIKGVNRTRVKNKLIMASLKQSWRPFVDNFPKLHEQLKKKGLFDELWHFEPIGTLEKAINKVEEHSDEIKILEELVRKIVKVEDGLKMLEKLRDTQTLKKMSAFLKELQETMPKIFQDYKDTDLFESISPDQLNDGSEGLQKIIFQISRLSSSILMIEQRFDLFSREWTQFDSFHAKANGITSKLQSGHLTGNFEKLRTCLEKSNELNFSVEKQQLSDIDKKLAEMRGFHKKFLITDELAEKYYKRMELFISFVDENNIEPLEPLLLKTVFTIDSNETAKDAEYLYPDQSGYKPKDPTRVKTLYHPFEVYAEKAHDSMKELDFDGIWKVVNGVNGKLEESLTFLTCYSDLKTANSELKSEIEKLLNVPIEEWSFDPIFMESAVEMVNLLKELYHMIEEIKTSKLDENDKKFPLKKENVREVSDGVESIQEILKIQKSWNQLAKWDNKNFKLDSWDTLKTPLSKFSEDLSQVEDVLQDSSKISFPSNLQIDPIIASIRSKYEGNRKMEYLRILEEIKEFSIKSNTLPDKLNKLNEAINKVEKWKLDAATTIVISEDFCDCSENLLCKPSCQTNLPDADPEELVEEFNQ